MEAAERLLVIDIIDARGLIILQTIWATTADRCAGPRLTRSETVGGPAALMQRLGELTPALFGADGMQDGVRDAA